jgi:hypothetical protein
MALVKYIKDNIDDVKFGFLTDDSSLRDYLINIFPVMFMAKDPGSFKKGFTKSIVEFKDKGVNDFSVIITDTQNDTLLKKLNRNFSIVLYRDKTITFMPLNKDTEIDVKSFDSEIVDLLEGELFYNIFMGFEKK